jgi:hypothetical protein
MAISIFPRAGHSGRLTYWTAGLPSSLTISVWRMSTESRELMSLAFGLLETTPRLTILSKRERPGFEPCMSKELGRGRRRELAPSTSLVNRPRGTLGLSATLPKSMSSRSAAEVRAGE